MGRYNVEKKNTNEIQWQVKKSELETPRYGRRKRKCDGHHHWWKPRIPEVVPVTWKLT